MTHETVPTVAIPWASVALLPQTETHPPEKALNGVRYFTLYFYSSSTTDIWASLSNSAICLFPYFREISFSHPTPNMVFQEQPHNSNMVYQHPFKAWFPWTRTWLIGGEIGELLMAIFPWVVWREPLWEQRWQKERGRKKRWASPRLSLRSCCPWPGNTHKVVSCSSNRSYWNLVSITCNQEC